MIDNLITFALAVTSVGLWTLRVAVTARGLRLAGSLVAMIEAVVFVLAFSHVLGSLETPGRIVVYGLGVGAGTFAGLSLDTAIRGSNHKGRPTPNEKEQDQMNLSQRRRMRRQRSADTFPSRDLLDLEIDEVISQLAHPFAITPDDVRKGDKR